MTYLLIHLASRFAPLGEEQWLIAQNELMNFDRLPIESIDALITRFMAIRSHAHTGGRMAMTWEGYSHLLLRACRVNPQQMVSLFSPFGGIPPTTEQQVNQMEMAIRRMGHILEGATFSLARQLQRPRQQTFLTQQCMQPSAPPLDHFGGQDPWASQSQSQSQSSNSSWV